jgi:hypothetical protein
VFGAAGADLTNVGQEGAGGLNQDTVLREESETLQGVHPVGPLHLFPGELLVEHVIVPDRERIAGGSPFRF